jgi:hypothetical protein
LVKSFIGDASGQKSFDWNSLFMFSFDETLTWKMKEVNTSERNFWASTLKLFTVKILVEGRFDEYLILPNAFDRKK